MVKKWSKLLDQIWLKFGKALKAISHCVLRSFHFLLYTRTIFSMYTKNSVFTLDQMVSLMKSLKKISSLNKYKYVVICNNMFVTFKFEIPCKTFEFLLMGIGWLVSYTLIEWVLNPWPYPPSNTYKRKRSN